MWDDVSRYKRHISAANISKSNNLATIDDSDHIICTATQEFLLLYGGQ